MYPYEGKCHVGLLCFSLSHATDISFRAVVVHLLYNMDGDYFSSILIVECLKIVFRNHLDSLACMYNV